MSLHRLDLPARGIDTLLGLKEYAEYNFISVKLPHNLLSSLDHFGSHPHLQELDVRFNQISSLLGLTRHRELRVVRLHGNPIAKHALYRVMVLLVVGFSVKEIDHVAITTQEVELAQSISPRAALAVSYGWLLDLTPRSRDEYDAIVTEYRSRWQQQRTMSRPMITIRDALAIVEKDKCTRRSPSGANTRRRAHSQERSTRADVKPATLDGGAMANSSTNSATVKSMLCRKSSPTLDGGGGSDTHMPPLPLTSSSTPNRILFSPPHLWSSHPPEPSPHEPRQAQHPDCVVYGKTRSPDLFVPSRHGRGTRNTNDAAHASASGAADASRSAAGASATSSCLTQDDLTDSDYIELTDAIYACFPYSSASLRASRGDRGDGDDDDDGTDPDGPGAALWMRVCVRVGRAKMTLHRCTDHALLAEAARRNSRLLFCPPKTIEVRRVAAPSDGGVHIEDVVFFTLRVDVAPSLRLLGKCLPLMGWEDVVDTSVQEDTVPQRPDERNPDDGHSGSAGQSCEEEEHVVFDRDAEGEDALGEPRSDVVSTAAITATRDECTRCHVRQKDGSPIRTDSASQKDASTRGSETCPTPNTNQSFTGSFLPNDSTAEETRRRRRRRRGRRRRHDEAPSAPRGHTDDGALGTEYDSRPKDDEDAEERAQPPQERRRESPSPHAHIVTARPAVTHESKSPSQPHGNDEETAHDASVTIALGELPCSGTEAATRSFMADEIVFVEEVNGSAAEDADMLVGAHVPGNRTCHIADDTSPNALRHDVDEPVDAAVPARGEAAPIAAETMMHPLAGPERDVAHCDANAPEVVVGAEWATAPRGEEAPDTAGNETALGTPAVPSPPARLPLRAQRCVAWGLLQQAKGEAAPRVPVHRHDAHAAHTQYDPLGSTFLTTKMPMGNRAAAVAAAAAIQTRKEPPGRALVTPPATPPRMAAAALMERGLDGGTSGAMLRQSTSTRVLTSAPTPSEGSRSVTNSAKNGGFRATLFERGLDDTAKKRILRARRSATPVQGSREEVPGTTATHEEMPGTAANSAAAAVADCRAAVTSNGATSAFGGAKGNDGPATQQLPKSRVAGRFQSLLIDDDGSSSDSSA